MDRLISRSGSGVVAGSCSSGSSSSSSSSPVTVTARTARTACRAAAAVVPLTLISRESLVPYE